MKKTPEPKVRAQRLRALVPAELERVQGGGLLVIGLAAVAPGGIGTSPSGSEPPP